MSTNQGTAMKPETSSKVGIIRYIIVGLMFCTFLVAYFDRSNITILLADLGFTDAFGITGDKAAQGLLMTGFMLSYGIFNFIAGPITNLFGPRKALLAAVLSWSILMVIMGNVTVFWVLVACRVLLGVGEAVMTPSCATIVQNWFPPKERAKANAVWFIGLLLAPAVTVPIVIWALGSFGWQGSFYVLALIGSIPFLLMLFLLKNHPKESSFVGKAELQHIGTPVFQKANENVDKDYSWLKESTFWFNVIASSALVALYWGLVAWVPSYYKTTLGFSWASMGALASLPFIAGTVAVLLASPIMDRLNNRSSFVLGGFILGGIFLLVAIFSTDRLVIAISLAMAIACAVPGVPAMYTILQNIVKPGTMPVAAGVFNGVGYVYGAFAPYIIGILVNLTGSFSAGFYFLVAQAVIGIIFALPLVKKRL